MNARDEAKDLQVDWALRERLGAQAPPDLTEAVLERLLREPADGGVMPMAAAAEGHAPSRLWLAAALVLLGIGAVLGAALWNRDSGQRSDAPAQQPVAPTSKPAEIANVADVAKLPADTRAIEAQAIGDEALAALAARAAKGGLPRLESLSVINSAHQTYGMGLKMTLPDGERSITCVGLRHIAELTKLRRLLLSGTFALRHGLEPGGQLLAGLVRLPMLQDLTVRFVDTTDADLAVLPRLSALQSLDLSFNHGFAAGGIDAVVQCSQLKSLSLRGCQQLEGAQLAKLGALQRLEHLDLGLIDGINWRNVPGEAAFEETPSLQGDRFDTWEVRAGGKRIRRRFSGVTDEALAGIAGAKELRWLDVSGGRFRTGAALAELSRLETLDVSSMALTDAFPSVLPVGLRELHVCCDFTDAFCTAVRERLRQLRYLDVAACNGMTDIGVASLIALPELRVLELRQCRGLSPGCIDLLVEARQIEELDLRHVDWVTAEHVQKLRSGMASLQVLQTSVEQSDQSETIRKRLEETKLEHHFASATVKDWATYYGNVTGVTFIVTAGVREMDAAITTLTDFKLPRMSVIQALTVIRSQTGVGWTLKDGMVLLVARSSK
jgi:hypothetical protein